MNCDARAKGKSNDVIVSESAEEELNYQPPTQSDSRKNEGTMSEPSDPPEAPISSENNEDAIITTSNDAQSPSSAAAPAPRVQGKPKEQTQWKASPISRFARKVSV